MSAEMYASIALVWGIFAVTWAYIVAYHRKTGGTWARSEMGWHLMAWVGSDALIFTFLAAASVWPQLGLFAWYRWSYLGAISTIFFTGGWRLAILYRAPRNPGSTPRPPRLRWPRPRWPASVWQVILGAAQVVNGVLLGGVGLKTALLIGAAQLAVACFAHGRSIGPAPATSP